MNEIYAQIAILIATAYLIYLFMCDYLGFGGASKPFAGATRAPLGISVLGVAGALVILAISTFSEAAFGVETEQSEVPFYILIFWLGNAFVEELVFRGYLVVQNRGNVPLIASCVFFSLVFALAHPFFWEMAPDEESSTFMLEFNFGAQAWIATLTIFANSLFFYYLRFARLNNQKSIIPCIAAHFTYNAGVYFVKLLQGYVAF